MLRDLIYLIVSKKLLYLINRSHIYYRYDIICVIKSKFKFGISLCSVIESLSLSHTLYNYLTRIFFILQLLKLKHNSKIECLYIINNNDKIKII